ncbi:MAG TPA: IS110 family transposase [Tepidisphaeraceae bacterium]
MEVLYACGGGLDGPKKTVVACLLRAGAGGQHSREMRSFATMTDDLLALADWLRAAGCTQVAMERTGVYWKPVYNILEGQLDVMVVNAAPIKAVPGRKTDRHDAEWIADLLQHGLARPSFIPDRPPRELRDLTRTRTTRSDERAAAVNRLQKVLEDANRKVARVATDIMGGSGRAMVTAMRQGTTDPATLAELAKGRLRTKRTELERALAGRVSAHHRLLLTTHLAHIDFLDEEIARLSAAIAERLLPVADAIQRLDTMPGVDRQTAEVLLAELGTELARFPTPAHLASGAGMCPGNHESAGKRRGGRTRTGSKWLRRALIEAAGGAVRTKQAGRTGLANHDRRLGARRGRQQALVAVGHRLLLIVSHVRRSGQRDQEPTPTDRDQRRRRRARDRAIDQRRQLGDDVTITPVPAVA